MARVARRRCSKSARLSVGDALGVEGGAGGVGDPACAAGGPACAAAAPVCLVRRGSGDDFAFAGLERVGGLPGGGSAAAASGVLAGVELWSEPLLVGDSALLGGAGVGGGIDCGSEPGITGTCAPGDPPVVELPFLEAQTAT